MRDVQGSGLRRRRHHSGLQQKRTGIAFRTELRRRPEPGRRHLWMSGGGVQDERAQ